MVEEFEIWWVQQPAMFANTVNAIYAFCEETGTDFNELYDNYFDNVVDITE